MIIDLLNRALGNKLIPDIANPKLATHRIELMSTSDYLSYLGRRKKTTAHAGETSHFVIQLYDYSTMWSFVSSLASELRKSSNQTKVIRLVGKGFGTSSSVQTLIFGALGTKTPFERALESVGIALEKKRVRGKSKISNLRNLSKSIPEEVLSALKLSALSQARSILRDSTLGEDTMLVKLLVRKLFTDSQTYFLWARDFSAISSDSVVYIPNGRMAIETALYFGFKSRNVSLNHYEASYFYDRGYISNHAPQDKRSHAKHRSQQRITSEDNIYKTIEDFLAERESKKNKFFSDTNSLERVKGDGRAITYFTSSSDEFDYLPKNWGYETPNGSQYERFMKICLVAQKSGPISITVKIHPNFMNKGVFQNIRELKEVKRLRQSFPDLKIILPTSNTNSYELVRNSDLVVTERSTIGLEALLMGKNVLCIADASYSELLPKKNTWKLSIKQDSAEAKLNQEKIRQFLARQYFETFKLHFPREYFWKSDPKVPALGIRISWIPTRLSIWTIVSLVFRLPTRILLNRHVLNMTFKVS